MVDEGFTFPYHFLHFSFSHVDKHINTFCYIKSQCLHCYGQANSVDRETSQRSQPHLLSCTIFILLLLKIAMFFHLHIYMNPSNFPPNISIPLLCTYQQCLPNIHICPFHNFPRILPESLCSFLGIMSSGDAHSCQSGNS